MTTLQLVNAKIQYLEEEISELTYSCKLTNLLSFHTENSHLMSRRLMFIEFKNWLKEDLLRSLENGEKDV